MMKALSPFTAGSSGGPEGIRLQHILDLDKCHEAGPELLTSITGHEGKCNKHVTPVIFGGQLIAMKRRLALQQSHHLVPWRSSISLSTWELVIQHNNPSAVVIFDYVPTLGYYVLKFGFYVMILGYYVRRWRTASTSGWWRKYNKIHDTNVSSSTSQAHHMHFTSNT